MKVLYIAPEYPSAGRTAAQVRANALLPQLAQRTDLQILAYPPPDGLSGRLLDWLTIQGDFAIFQRPLGQAAG